MKTSLPLSDVTLTYGRADGAPYMELTTADPRLTGKAFHVRISRNSPTYRNLLALLEAEKALPELQVDIPTNVRIESVDALLGTKPATELFIGVGEENVKVAVPLTTPHMLIAGIPGCGKTILVRNVVASVLARPRTRLLLGGLSPQALGPYHLHLRKEDRAATSPADVEELVETLRDELREKKRITALAEAAGKKSRRTRQPHTFLVLDDFSAIMCETSPLTAGGYPSPGKSSIQKALLELLQDGPRYGIYVVISGSDFIGSREIIRKIGTRILLAEGTPTLTYDILGQAAYEGQVLHHRGRGIVSSYGAQQRLFQGYFLPISAMAQANTSV
jgi:hypothetical protein